MKKTLAVFTVLALTMMSLTAHAACGSNTGRNSSTRAPGSTGSSGTGSTGNTGAASAGTPR